MDNITHSLVGAFVGEGVAQLGHKKLGPLRRRLLILTSIIANNLPDLDFVYTGMTQPSKIGYLLHHRGHTHTLVMVPLLAALSVLLAFGCSYRHRKDVSKADLLAAFGMGCLGVILHIGFDALNVYGVHPFWPFNNSWIYLDTLFIIEPLLWLILVPVLMFFSINKWVNRFYRALILLGLALMVFTKLVPGYSIALGVLLTGFFGWGIRNYSNKLKWAAGFIGIAVVIVSFGISRQFARALSSKDVPGNLTVKDLVLSPYPANPICWILIRVGQGENNYSLERGTLSIFPRLISPTSCPLMRGSTPTINFSRTPPNTGYVNWDGEYSASIGEFKRLAESNCTFGAFLQFARAPFWELTDSHLIMGDLRFDREVGLGFSEIATPMDSRECPKNLAGWNPPRSDILQ